MNAFLRTQFRQPLQQLLPRRFVEGLSASQGPHRLQRPPTHGAREAVRGTAVPQHPGEGRTRQRPPLVGNTGELGDTGHTAGLVWKQASTLFFNYTIISAYKIFFYSVSKILFQIFCLCYWISLPIMIVKMEIFLHTVYKIFNK